MPRLAPEPDNVSLLWASVCVVCKVLSFGVEVSGWAPQEEGELLSLSPDWRRPERCGCDVFWGIGARVCVGSGQLGDPWRWSASADGKWGTRGHFRVRESVSASDWMNGLCGWVLLALWQERL